MSSGQEQLFARARLAGEWRIANGAGGFAHGPATGPPTRRDHAWLHAWNGGRANTMLLGLEELVHVAGRAYALGELGAETPEAETLAETESFAADPLPRWRLRCGELLLERTLFLISGQQAVAVRYRHLAGPPARLRLGPLVVARDPDEVQHETSEMRGLAHGIPGRVRIETMEGRPTLTLWHNGTFLPSRLWRRGIAYAADPHPAVGEDALVPGTIDCPLPPESAAHVVAATDESLFRDLAVDGRLGSPPPSTLADCVTALERFERMRHEEFRDLALRGLAVTARQAAAAHEGSAPPSERDGFLSRHDPWTARLVRGLEGGLARRGGRITVLHSDGEERGAEALRAVPGLIAAQAFEVVRGMLSGFLGYADDGATPSGFDAQGAPRYEDPTVALWLLIDAELLTRRSEDPAWARVSLGPLESIPQHLRSGSRYGVRADADGLLQLGDPPVKPMVLNVLWYYALVAVSQLARLGARKEGAAFYLAWARQHGQSFNERFWNEEEGALFEEIAGGRPRAGLTAEQLWAVAFAPPLLPPERAERLLERIEGQLFTPLGLRPRPGTAHVETAWLGAFHSACLRVRGRSAEMQALVRSRLERLSACLERVALGHVPASFTPPSRKGGRRTAEEPLERWRPAGASAVAAAELLRLWVEDVAHPAGSAALP